MLATGHHAHPRSPTFPGLDRFKGRTTNFSFSFERRSRSRPGEKLHSWQYKTSRGFEDKNVLVVGIGNSGGDLAVELGRIAKQVYLSTRRGTWVFNRVGPSGWPADLSMVSELAAIVQRNFPRLTNWLMERTMNGQFNHELYGLKPQHRPLRTNVEPFFVV